MTILTLNSLSGIWPRWGNEPMGISIAGQMELKAETDKNLSVSQRIQGVYAVPCTLA